MLHCKLSIVLIFLIATCDVARSSSAGFTVSTVEQQLEESNTAGDIPIYSGQTRVGETLTFVAQGIVYPRGGSPQPSEPDAGAWLFDDTVFELVPHDKSQCDGTQVIVALRALRGVLRPTRVRFVGNILGYSRKYDVRVKVTN